MVVEGRERRRIGDDDAHAPTVERRARPELEPLPRQHLPPGRAGVSPRDDRPRHRRPAGRRVPPGGAGLGARPARRVGGDGRGAARSRSGRASAASRIHASVGREAHRAAPRAQARAPSPGRATRSSSASRPDRRSSPARRESGSIRRVEGAARAQRVELELADRRPRGRREPPLHARGPPRGRRARARDSVGRGGARTSSSSSPATSTSSRSAPRRCARSPPRRLAPIPASIDQVLVRGAAATARRWPPEEREYGGRLLSDHAPVEAAF